MEQNFQTSFIPKKPMIADRSIAPRPISVWTILTLFIFFAMLVSTGVLFFYKGVLTKNIADMANQLTLAQNRFEPAKITQLQVLDKRLKAATTILANHITVSPIFQVLGALTMKTVAYTKFDYQLGALPGDPITVNMSGVAVGYRSIALQADLFSTDKSLIDPVFSNLSLDDKGNVIFDLQFSVDPSFVNYGEVLKTEAAQAAAAAATVPVSTAPADTTGAGAAPNTTTVLPTGTVPASPDTSAVPPVGTNNTTN